MTSFIVSFFVNTQNVPEVASVSVIRLHTKIIKPNLPRVHWREPIFIPRQVRQIQCNWENRFHILRILRHDRSRDSIRYVASLDWMPWGL